MTLLLWLALLSRVRTGDEEWPKGMRPQCKAPKTAAKPPAKKRMVAAAAFPVEPQVIAGTSAQCDRVG